jgi:hypothetical protein
MPGYIYPTSTSVARVGSPYPTSSQVVVLGAGNFFFGTIQSKENRKLPQQKPLAVRYSKNFF